MSKTVLDIVFLVDATASMHPVLAGLRKNIHVFIQNLNTSLFDWQCTIVAYRDINFDGALWYEDHPFVSTLPALQDQIDGIIAQGGLDIENSLLHAMQKVLTTTSWRNAPNRKRSVIIITASTFKNPAPTQGMSGILETVMQQYEQEHVATFFLAPALLCYEELTEMSQCTWECFEEPFLDSLIAITNDHQKFQKILLEIIASHHHGCM